VLCTSVGSAVPPTSRELRLPPEKRQAAVYSDVWLALSNIFCFSVPADYMPAEDIIENVLPVTLTDPGPEKKKKKKGLVAKLNPLNWTGSGTKESGKRNHLVFSRNGDYKRDKKLLYTDLAEESQRIGQLYAGIIREHGVIFDWSLKASKNGVHIQTCDIPGSSFQAMKTDTVIKKDKYTILKVIIDDDRAKEYDESLEGYEVRMMPFIRVVAVTYRILYPASDLLISFPHLYCTYSSSR
jgi:hypothetical protein